MKTICTPVLIALITVAVPAAAQQRKGGGGERHASNAAVERWVDQLANDLDHLQEDLHYERGKYPADLREQVDQVSYVVAHFQQTLREDGDRSHLERDFEKMDGSVHKLVKALEKTGDDWLRRQASRLRSSDEQLHYVLQRQVEKPKSASRELLTRQVYLLKQEARDLEKLAERVNRRDSHLREAIHDYVGKVEHFHEVVEDGAKRKHVHEDFHELDDAWEKVVDQINGSSSIYYLRTAAQNVNRVHNQVQELVEGGREPMAEAAELATPPQPRPRPAIQFEIPGVGRFQIPR